MTGRQVTSRRLSQLPQSQSESLPIYLDDEVDLAQSWLYRMRAQLALCAVLVIAVACMFGGYQWSSAKSAREMLDQERRHSEQLSTELAMTQAKLKAFEVKTEIEDAAKAGVSALASIDGDLLIAIILGGAVVVGCLLMAGAVNPAVMSGALAIAACCGLIVFAMSTGGFPG